MNSRYENYLTSFVRSQNLRQADAVVVKKDFFGILDHYVIYLGKEYNGTHKFIANYNQGIKILPSNEMEVFLQRYSPVRVNRFVGTRNQRIEAIQRALSRRNENSYNLILNNCEHYKNFVHHGIKQSDQVTTVGSTLLIGGIAAAIIGDANDNEKTRDVGLATAGFGLLTLLLDGLNNSNDK